MYQVHPSKQEQPFWYLSFPFFTPLVNIYSNNVNIIHLLKMFVNTLYNKNNANIHIFNITIAQAYGYFSKPRFKYAKQWIIIYKHSLTKPKKATSTQFYIHKILYFFLAKKAIVLQHFFMIYYYVSIGFDFYILICKIWQFL